MNTLFAQQPLNNAAEGAANLAGGAAQGAKNLAGGVGDGAKNLAGGATNALENVLSVFDSVLGPGFGAQIAKVVVALLVFLIGKWIAKRIGKLVSKGFSKTSIDERLASKAGMKSGGIGDMLGMMVYYLILLFVGILALDIAGMSQAVEPLKGMLNDFLGYIPNLLSGGILLFVVVMIAKIVKGLLEGVMTTARVDERLGMMSGNPVTSGVSNGIFYFIILMMLPAILGVFNLPGVTEPVTAMVEKITTNIPSVVTGLVLLAIGYLVASIVQKLVYNMLTAANVNSIPAKMGFTGKIETEGNKSPAGIVSLLVMITIMVTIATQALGMMNLGYISELGQSFMGGYFNLLGAIIILGIAFFLSNLVHGHLKGSNATLANIAKWAILVFAGFIALSTAGISPSITETPFQVLTYAIGVALGVGGAIAIGLGGKDTAAKWLNNKFG